MGLRQRRPRGLPHSRPCYSVPPAAPPDGHGLTVTAQHEWPRQRSRRAGEAHDPTPAVMASHRWCRAHNPRRSRVQIRPPPPGAQVRSPASAGLRWFRVFYRVELDGRAEQGFEGSCVVGLHPRELALIGRHRPAPDSVCVRVGSRSPVWAYSGGAAPGSVDFHAGLRNRSSRNGGRIPIARIPARISEAYTSGFEWPN